MDTKRGRPKKDIPSELVQEIIYRYTSDYNVSGKVTYMEVYRYSQHLFEKGEIPLNIGEFFWRKGEGRAAVDKTNQILTHTVTNSFIEDEDFVDTEDAINKFFNGNKTDKKKLIGALKMNETKLQKYIQKSKKLEKELFETRQDLVIKIEQSKSLQENVSKLQERMFQWMELSMNKKLPLTNLMTVGQTRTETVKVLLESMLSDNPLKAFDSMVEFQQNDIKSIKLENKDQPTSLDSYKKKKSVLDDFDF